LETEWAKYPVFHIDFNGTDFTKANTLETKLKSHIEIWELEYGKSPISMTIGDRFAYVLKRAHEQYGRRAVVLIDEYDKPILDVLDTTLTTEVDGERRALEDVNRDLLKGFYSTFKAADEDLQFVLLTGVTKFSQVSVFSGFNQPADISMDRRYEALCGITEAELYSYFDESIRSLATEYDMSEAEMKDFLNTKITEKFHIDELCSHISRSESQTIRLFKRAYGITPYTYVLNKRLELGKSLLNNTNLTVKEIADKLCFADEYYFSNLFKSKVGMTPSSYRKKFKGAEFNE
jgi:AraC-like DNA-binding protein